MFLKGIKRKSAQKYITKVLKKSRVVGNGKIQNLGILVDATTFREFPFVDEIAEVFDISPNSIKILYYHPNKKISEAVEGEVYTDVNLGLKGVVKNSFVANFIETEFDALLSFYDKDELLLNLVAVQSKANFKIGFATVSTQVNDFSVATKLTDIKTFTIELKKYLSILNKI